MHGSRRRIMDTREKTAAALEELGFRVCPSQANFLFVSHPERGGKELLDTLRAQGILVRWWGKPRIEDYLRITIGTEEEMEQLIQVLRQTLGRDQAQK